jgi:6-phosphofructokinase 1
MSSRRIVATRLGEPGYASPLSRTSTPGDGAAKFVAEDSYLRYPAVFAPAEPEREELLFECAGARQRLFFPPEQVKAALVTCGGLCPGLNAVIRSAFLELHMNYGVREILGIRYGYQGLNPKVGQTPLTLNLEMVDKIHHQGGTILGSSRGNQDPAVMVDCLQYLGVNMLFCVGGDGTQRGAHALYEEVQRRGLPIAVVGVPKTIDNDVEYCERTFGFTTAVEQARKVLDCAHVESKGAPNGIALVKVMGRDAGFIAAAATLASQEVNFTLIPEVPFAMEGPRGFLAALYERMLNRKHAVIVVAEGAGQHLLKSQTGERDASGNVRYQDIGQYLKQEITAYFRAQELPVELKFIDPSYIIRSVPANCEDAVLCDQYARRAVHAAMAGKTDMLIGNVDGHFVHVPIPMAVEHKRHVNMEGELWGSVLAATGQPRRFE